MYTNAMDDLFFVPLSVKEAYCAAQSAKARKLIIDELDCRAIVEKALEDARTDEGGTVIGHRDEHLDFKSKAEEEEFNRAMTEPG